jgi:hypothetical protein
MPRKTKAKIMAGALLLLVSLLVLWLNISFVYVAVTQWKVVVNGAVSVFFACSFAGFILGAIFAAVCVKPLDWNHLEDKENEDHIEVP